MNRRSFLGITLGLPVSDPAPLLVASVRPPSVWDMEPGDPIADLNRAAEQIRQASASLWPPEFRYTVIKTARRQLDAFMLVTDADVF